MSNNQTRSDATNRSRIPHRFQRRSLAALLFAAGATLALGACSRSTAVNSPGTHAGASEQTIVENSAAAFDRVQQDPRFSRMGFYLQRARAVMIFPRLVKASLIVGGEGGNGVLVARQADGSWSAPAFYSLGSPSIGLQVGYQQATVVLFIMDQSTLEHALNSSIALGAKAGVSLGDVDEHGGTKGDVATANIHQVVDAEGVFAGLSLDGYVIGARARRNLDYYGKAVTPREILIDGSVHEREAGVLALALAPRTKEGQAAVSSR